MSELPQGWTTAPLGVIGSWGSGGTPSRGNSSYFEGHIPWAVIGDLKDGTLTSTQQTISKNGLDNSAAKLVPANALLVAMYGSIGKLAITGIECATNQAIAFCVPDTETIALRYLFYSILQSRNALNELGQGAGQQNISQTILKEFKIPLAPLAEQKRIAQKLDALLAQVDTLKARIDAIPALLKRFRQSVLSAAVSGRLTSQTAHESTQGSRFQPPLVFFASEQGEKPIKWKWEKLADLATLESGHTPRKSVPKYWDGGDVPWISLQDIRAADGKEIFETKFKPTMLGIQNSSARLLPKGTVCFSRDISVGFVTVMGRSMATTQHFANWICGDELSPKYLMYAFMAGRDHLLKSGQGSTVKTIYMPALKELRLRLPPLSEQREIVRRVEQLFAYADQLETKVAAAQQRIDALTQSLLAKAFRGELVPQDPTDEPASVLLERIRAQRAAAPKPKRGRKAATS
ncbi:restriction endonuclease subunit S [Xanthomonas oryzae pv. oryzicola]|uniref:restriction endonuclease subunit S n=1 Tax=Xanthomonas oryzae TaxID=347 RepID=UPI000654CA73|nr:restriction endonuclease subunit S [Xanthomonas oryzae]AKO07688.1 hypothetical protein ACU17_06005 [Xanthomonas oryzae pv. oryzicola]